VNLVAIVLVGELARGFYQFLRDVPRWTYLLSLAVVLGAVGTSLLLPHRHGRLKALGENLVGAGLVAAAIVLLALAWQPAGALDSKIVFYIFGITAVTGGVLTVTSRDPVYGALWFASVVLSTSALFLLAGAEFLAAGTIIVYAGAIIVTFLFVLMLAQAGGRAEYDRMARSPRSAVLSSFLLLWGLGFAILGVQASNRNPGKSDVIDQRLTRGDAILTNSNTPAGSPLGTVVDRAVRPESDLPTSPDPNVPAPHVAGLGGALYTNHLVTIEVVGVLLFVALIAALAIATPKAPIRPASAPR